MKDMTFTFATDALITYIYDGDNNSTLAVPEWQLGGEPPGEVRLRENEDGMEFTLRDDMDDGRNVYETDDFNDIVLTTNLDLGVSFHATLEKN